jgi:hypothetical protein
MRRRPIPNQSRCIVGSDGLKLLSSRTLPNVVLAMVSEAGNAHLPGAVMGKTWDQLETKGPQGEETPGEAPSQTGEIFRSRGWIGSGADGRKQPRFFLESILLFKDYRC